MKDGLFMRNITVLDHGFINEYGKVQGGSYHVSVNVSGKIEKDESVIIDFSKGKHQIKEIIDDKELGFDHKLIIFNTSNVKSITTLSNKRRCIVTPYLEAIIPTNAMQFSLSTKKSRIEALTEDITELLKYKLPQFEFEVELSENGFTDSDQYFRYSHGLKSSTSWGCQNFGHGHLSFVEVKDDNFNQNNSELCKLVSNLFNNKILIFKENVVEQKENEISIKLETRDRGTIYATYKDHDILILDTETTIEYMSQYVKEQLGTQLKGYSVFISEGLAKGNKFYCE